MNVRQLSEWLCQIEGLYGGSVEVFAFDAAGVDRPLSAVELWILAGSGRPALMLRGGSPLANAKPGEKLR